ncbi:MAG: electron transport complex subunit E [Candidatus Omnitrophota bacterium]
MKQLLRHFTKGFIAENPVLVLIIGLCPALAVSNTMTNAIGMGIAVTFVVLCSNIIISALRKFIPDKIRIPCFIVIIATFVTLVELLMKAYSPGLSKSLGIFVPLIVVNCMVLGRAEAFACKNPILPSILDGLGMGAGFTIALLAIAFVRELLGAGEIFGIAIGKWYEPAMFFILAPGALLTIGLLIGLNNLIFNRK